MLPASVEVIDFTVGSVGIPGPAGITRETVIVATYADIVVSGRAPHFVIVAADETNGGFRTTYFYDGATLNWVPLVGA